MAIRTSRRIILGPEACLPTNCGGHAVAVVVVFEMIHDILENNQEDETMEVIIRNIKCVIDIDYDNGMESADFHLFITPSNRYIGTWRDDDVLHGFVEKRAKALMRLMADYADMAREQRD